MTLTKRAQSDIISLSNRMVNRAFCLCLPGDSQQKLWAKRPSCVMLSSALPFGLTAWQITRWGHFAMGVYKNCKPPEKQCNKCHQWKSLEMFYNSHNSFDGKTDTCKDCMYPNHSTPWEGVPRVCPNCQLEFTPGQPNQLYCYPRCCQAYYEKEIRRVGRFLILERDGFRCIYCGMSSIEDATQLHVDHIVPRTHDGEDTAGNLVTACIRCNLEKSSRLIGEKNIARLLAEVERRNLEHGIEPQLTIKL